MSREFIIKNYEKGIKCLEHPDQKNTVFCFDCNTHLCKKCLESKKHMMHRKNTLTEVKPNEEMKKKLDGIINTYRENIELLKKKKEQKEVELNNKFEKDSEKIKEDNENKIKEIEEELNKEILENERTLNSDLYEIKMNF